MEADYHNTLDKKLSYYHQRKLILEDGKYFYIEDTVHCRNIVSMENLIHPHPECAITMMDGKIKLSREKLNVFIVFDKKELKAELRDWFYTPQFGKILDAKVIVLLPLKENPGQISYSIIPEALIENKNAFK